MGIENPTPTYIDDLDASLPGATDPLSQADDHIRNIKRVLKQNFPNITGPVTKTQAQLDSTHAATADTCTGNAATATTAAACTGNAATATTAGACTGNAATATTADTATNANAVDGKSIAVVSSMPGSPDANTIYFVT